MLSAEMNERLTRVGTGTPLGNLLRRYWYPIARTPELDVEPVLAVTLLGENLALYRTDNGDLGLVSLRCAYHGWKFSPSGTCLEQPAEPTDSSFHDRVRVTRTCTSASHTCR